MDEVVAVDVETSSASTSGNPVLTKRPTIIRASPRSGATNYDEDNKPSSNTSSVDSVPQPAENSDAVIKRACPPRPSTGPSRAPSFQAPARPASVHFRSSDFRSAPRPASVHLPLSQAPSVKDKPATAGKPQKKRPEITIVSARPLSEVGGFSKDTSMPSGPSPAAKTTSTTTSKLTLGAPVAKPTTAAAEDPSDATKSYPVPTPRRGVDKPTPEAVNKKPEPPGVTGATAMSGAPPPLPTNRPKGPYVPPPLPSTRPKGAYVHPGSVSSSSVTEGQASAEPAPVPKPRPRSVGPDTEDTSQGAVLLAAPSRPPKPLTQNHVSDESSKPATPKDRGHADSVKPIPVLPASSSPELEGNSKFHVRVKSKSPVPVQRSSQAPAVPQVPLKPADKPALPHPISAPKPAERPSLPHPVAAPKPVQQHADTSAAVATAPSDSHKFSQGSAPPKPTMPLVPPASGQKYSRADILSLFDSTFQKNSKPESSSDAQMKVAGAVARNASTEDALKFGSKATAVAASDKTRSSNEVNALQFAGAVAQNTTADDVSNISGGVQMLRKSEDGQKAVGSFSRIAKSTAADVRSSDSSSGDLKWQVASSAAKNMTADDAKNIGKAGFSIAKSEEGRKAASSLFSITSASLKQVNQTQSQNTPAPNSAARARPKNTGQQGGPSLGSLVGLMPPPKTPAQTAAKPSTSGQSRSAPVPKFKISAESFTAGAQRSKPTIIRPGAEKPGSKPNSRTSSPETKRKVPPPRPTSGPQGRSKGSAPPRPNAPSSQPKSASSANLKPKRRAPLRPEGTTPQKSSQSESLPPRPGPGHPLYNKYMVSEPHGIALYDYKPIQPDELGFKADDVIILLQRIDADWLRGRCGNAEGLLPAAFLKIVKDIPQTNSKPNTSEPSAVAVYCFDGTASDELTFKEGDSIVLLDRVGDQWYRGQCKGRTGIFPANHVKIIEDLPVKSVTSSSSNVSGPRCKAKFDYDSTNPNDLTFKEGDLIQLMEDVGSQWLKGQLRGKTGIFPESFVEVLEPLPTAAKKSPTVMNGNSGNVVKAMFDFDAAESNEISFRAGDKIRILSQVNSEWLHGELRSGVQGNLPSAFVDHIPANLPSFSVADSPAEIGECVVKFDFEPAGEGELALKVGNRVTLLEYVGEDWLRGRSGSKEGIFPKTFVEIVGKGGASSGGPSLGTCKAMYDFNAEEPDELTIKNGDVIEILEHISADWIKGRLKGKTGKFPKAFVDVR
ncbi:protein app1-like [Acanthaster planci]|uniref:Protein app1-like n=1 Tax=Acanthaster planci TaxID=133434 RepID=A0A8B7XXL5_ACAPL|nr:protein app1-like [Acanthaster planci]